MTKNKPYQQPEEIQNLPQVQDDSVMEYVTTQLPPYTMEELNARINEAEAEITNGETYLHAEVMSEMRSLALSLI